MEKKRDIKVFIEQLTKPRVEALFSELFDEYANKGIDKKQFAVKLLTGELEGIMDDYVDAFIIESYLKNLGAPAPLWTIMLMPLWVKLH